MFPGKKRKKRYYDVKVNISRGQYGSSFIYNRSGEYIESVPIDENGQKLFYFDKFLQPNP